MVEAHRHYPKKKNLKINLQDNPDGMHCWIIETVSEKSVRIIKEIGENISVNTAH